MNPSSRTFAFVAAAGLSALAAFGAWYSTQPSSVSGFADVGTEFFTDFDDPTKATSLAVVDYDSTEKDVQTFSVKQNDDGLWVIPSHHNYPAEAEDRLAKTATSLLGLKKTAVQSRSKDDWKLYGVAAPDADGAATGEERGTRLTLSDGSGNPLVDLIIGKPVEGRSGSFYVREPEKNTTYIAQLNVDLSAKFSDWIEPDLLKITQTDLVKIVLDNYSIDEQQETVNKKEVLEFEKEKLETSGKWTLANLKDESEEFDASPIQSIATNLDQLKIVGVRPKPQGLDDNMRINPAVKQILQMQMQAQGYFIGGDKDGKERLYSNEGELIAGTNNGVQYTLYFGEIARGSGKDIEVGLAADEKKEDTKDESDKTADEESGEEDGPRRYLLVKVNFNEALLGEKPVAPIEPTKPEILNEAAPEKSAPVEAAPGANKKDESKAETTETESPVDSCDPQDEPTTEPTVETPATESPAQPATQEETSPAKPEPATTQEPAATPQKTEEVKSGDTAKAEDAPPKNTEQPATKSDAEDAKPEEPKEDPKQIAQQQYDAAMGLYETEKKAYEEDLKKFEDKVKAGQEKVKELSTRFAGWYYVISSDSFEKFRIERKDVVSTKATLEDALKEQEAPEQN
ncbi:MAG: DUF4340 domain-containing protein [Fuerstiella sp.]